MNILSITKPLNKYLMKLFWRLALFCIDKLYNLVDKDKDGKLSKEELKAFYELLQEKMNDLKKKIRS